MKQTWFNYTLLHHQRQLSSRSTVTVLQRKLDLYFLFARSCFHLFLPVNIVVAMRQR